MDQSRVEEIAIGQLNAGERMLWAGAPAPGKVALGALPATLFGIPFTGFAVFWIWTAADTSSRASGPWSFFPLFGVPFLLIGLGVLLAPVWAWLGARHTVYAVTDRRALIITGAGTRSVRSFEDIEGDDIMRTEEANGHGSVYFASQAYTTSKGFPRIRRMGFEGIAEVRRVEQLIRDHVQKHAA